MTTTKTGLIAQIALVFFTVKILAGYTVLVVLLFIQFAFIFYTIYKVIEIAKEKFRNHIDKHAR
jgi:hypothetical protein